MDGEKGREGGDGVLVDVKNLYAWMYMSVCPCVCVCVYVQ